MKQMTWVLLGACLVCAVNPVAARPPRNEAKAEMIASDGGGFVGPTMQFTMWPDGQWWHRKGIGRKAAEATGRMTPDRRDAFLKGLADAGLFRTKSANMHPNVPSLQVRIRKGGKWVNVRVRQNHKLADAIRRQIDAVAAKPPAAKMKAIAISLKVPDSAWQLGPEGAYQVGGEVWAVWQLTRRAGMGLTVITTRKSAVYTAPSALPVKRFILGKTWNWKNAEPYTFVAKDAQAAFKKQLAAGKKLPWSTTPSGEDKPLTVESLRAAPQTVSVSGTTLRLWAYLWRDFMPTVGRRGAKKGLLVNIKVAPVDAKAIPEGLVAETLWLIKGTEVWTSAVKEARSRGPVLDATIRNGPPWPTGIKVDVVVRIRAKDGKTYLLRAANQMIRRVS